MLSSKRFSQKVWKIDDKSKVEIEKIKRQIATIKGEPQKGPTNQPVPSESENHFVLKGDYWTIAYQGETSNFKNTKGLRYIARLIQNQGKEIGVADLYYAINPLDTGSTEFTNSALTSRHLEESNLSIGDPGSYLPAIDEQTIREILQRILKINDDIEIAKDTGNLARVSELDAEKAELVNYQSKNLGLKGKPRSVSNKLKRINDSVKKCIRRDLKKIDTNLPLLGRHLRNVALGSRLDYCPDQPVDWIITLK